MKLHNYPHLFVNNINNFQGILQVYFYEKKKKNQENSGPAVEICDIGPPIA